MVATMTCQASMLKTGHAKPASPSNLPAQPSLGFSRPQTATFAASGALAYGSDLITATVRKANKKLEEVNTDEMFSSFLGKKEGAKQSSGPVFRSALEQVSYETNSFLNQDSRKPAKRRTVAGRVARLFGK